MKTLEIRLKLQTSLTAFSMTRAVNSLVITVVTTAVYMLSVTYLLHSTLCTGGLFVPQFSTVWTQHSH